jgi:dTDP-4-dehydrorhamnose reductase
MNSPLSRVLILGGGGMLAHAFKALLPAATGITAPPRSELDITRADSLRQALDGSRPTLILNCAAHTKVDFCEFQRDLAFEINALAAGEVARQAARLGVPLVHFSTDFVFPGTSPTPYRETDPTGPLSVYGQSKLAGEIAVSAQHPDALICRTSWLYGPGGPCFPATMVRVARMGKPLTVVSDQHGVPTFTYDLVRYTLALVESGSSGVFHVSNSEPTTWFEFTRHILGVYGLQVPLTPISSADWKAKTPWSAHRPAYSTLDTTRLSQVLRSAPRSWKQAFAEYQPLAG